MKLLRLALSLLLVMGLAGCSGMLTTPAADSPEAAEITAPGLTKAAPVSVASPGAVASATLTPEILKLRVWLPPQFDPEANTASAQLLKARLKEFVAQHPGWILDVRVKAVEGPGNLVDALTAASTAAPQALPDLVALPYERMELAASRGLLHPFGEQARALESSDTAVQVSAAGAGEEAGQDSDWYEYARQLGRLQNNVFGLPFAGDALVLVYHANVLKVPPTNWEALLQLKQPLIFAAADPQALFTLAQYQGHGGEIHDDQGRPSLDVNLLKDVFAFYQEASQSGVMPVYLSGYADDGAVWKILREGRSVQGIAWATDYLSATITNTLPAPLPMPAGVTCTLASGWVWAVTAPHLERQELSARLAAFLTEPSFMASWSEAAGYLPSRRSALLGWKNTRLREAFEPILTSARPYPSTELLKSLGPALQTATLQVIKNQGDPLAAAQMAAGSLTGP